MLEHLLCQKEKLKLTELSSAEQSSNPGTLILLPHTTSANYIYNSYIPNSAKINKYNEC